MRVWTVPMVALIAVAGNTSPITLVGSVEPAVTTVAAGAPPSAVPAGSPPPGTAGVRASRHEARPPVPPPARRVDCERVRCVALTFDDGPGPYTGWLLDLLAERRVRASFFVVGRMVSEEDEAVLRRMVAEGHELGNHTWNHPQLTRLDPGEVREELGRTQWLVKRVTGVTMGLMRPPYGLTGPWVAAESRHLGLAQILWNVDTRDWHDRDVSVVAHRAAGAGPGSIVLLHDIHPSTVRAVPRLLDDLAGRGYRFVTLSELYGRRPVPGRRYYYNP
ncbi:polysaccharide deacetylase family protein [Streptosporangium sp. NPDC050855]|uniref:polysaccharide deacetylase family protein n=1 Tax=Streptosporangium sp. NPDC050855 TaxID=3366194 RepID=UPI003787F496